MTRAKEALSKLAALPGADTDDRTGVVSAPFSAVLASLYPGAGPDSILPDTRTFEEPAGSYDDDRVSTNSRGTVCSRLRIVVDVQDETARVAEMRINGERWVSPLDGGAS